MLEMANEHILPIVLSVVIVALYLIIRVALLKWIDRHAERNQIASGRRRYARKLSKYLLTFVAITILGAVWEITLQGLTFYFASAFTLLGVALFANWSVLSNLTSSLVLFFIFPHRIGDRVRVVDGDNSMEGEILDVGSFYVLIDIGNGETAIYPNNLMMQKPVVISNSRARQ